MKRSFDVIAFVAVMITIVIYSFCSSTGQVLIPMPSKMERPQVTVDDTVNKLESEYGIEIAQAGEKASFSFMDNRYGASCRSPNLIELDCLAKALVKSIPAHQKRGGRSRAVKIYFLSESLCCGARADWGLNQDNRPAIFVEPNSSVNNLTLAFIHELAHNTAYRLGFNPSDSDSWYMLSRLGWSAFANPDTGERGWLIKLGDGNTYKVCTVMPKKWVRTNKLGQPLDENGCLVKRQIDGQLLEMRDVSAKAIVRPISLYFPTPMEVYAEGLTYYRASATSRQFLEHSSPELFKLMELEHQRDLNLASRSCMSKKEKE